MEKAITAITLSLVLVPLMAFAQTDTISANPNTTTENEASAPIVPYSTNAIDQYGKYYLDQTRQAPGNGTVKVTFFGTSMLLFNDGNTQLLIDAFITHPSKEALLKDIPIQTNTTTVDELLARPEFHKPVAIFAAHSHFDHVLDAAYIAQKTGAHLYGSNSTLNVGRGWGLPESQMSLYEPGKDLTFGNFTVTVLASKHSPSIPGINEDIGQGIPHALKQPAPWREFHEGGTFDFLIKQNGRSILVKPSDNWLDGGLENVHADVLFLGTATMGHQSAEFREELYNQTIARVHPQLVVPLHWNDFTIPTSNHLVAGDPANLTTAFDFLIKKLSADHIEFGIMQGYQSIMLFAGGNEITSASDTLPNDF